MEEKNKVLTFTNLQQKKVEKTEKVEFASNKREQKIMRREEFQEIKLEGNVTLLVVEDHEEDYTKIYTLDDVLSLDRRKPSNIAGFVPPLFSDFKDRVKNIIRTYVKVGDTVVVKAKYMDGTPPRKVVDVHLSSLADMTVVVATLSDGDLQLTNRLIIT